MIRFLHTSDWQLGMTRHFLSKDNQARFAQARFDVIRALGRIAKEKRCQFMVVCGDVFESNHVDRKTVLRALEALKEVPVPVYLLPGNHDPLHAASVYQSSVFAERKPDNVHVIENTDSIKAAEGLEIVGIPWLSKRPVGDLVAETIDSLSPAAGTVRICLGHGAVDSLSPDPDAPGIISLARVEETIRQRKVHYLALGDRHSLTDVDSNHRVWYSGAPEPTDYDEVRPRSALVVEINEEKVSTEVVEVGTWNFIEHERLDVNNEQDIRSLQKWLEDLPNKERSIVKLRLFGALSLFLRGQLYAIIASFQDLLGALEISEENLVVAPEDSDFSDLGFSGFVSGTVGKLRERIGPGGPGSIVSQDALMLLVRLARSSE